MNQQNATRYFLFPHAVMAEPEARLLALFLPNLHLLEILNPVQLPDWSRSHFVSYPALQDQDLSERVRRYLHDYLDYAEVHRDCDTLSLLGQEKYHEGDDPSRFLLQSELRGRSPQRPDMPAWLRLEAAAFLELAHELDERELELESHYRRMEELEKGFREILGVIDGEEMEEIIETVNPPLISDHSRFSYQLARRSLSWYRLFADNLFQPDFIPVALTREVAGELADPAQTWCERGGKEFHMEQRAVASLPNLADLSHADFTSLWRRLLESGTLRSYWQALDNAVLHAREQDHWEDTGRQLSGVREQIFEFGLEQNLHPKGQGTLVMSHIHGVSHHDLWRQLDKTGFEHLSSASTSPPVGVTLFHLEWGV
jgi:hypothetical protein